MSTHRISVPSAVRRWWALVVLLTGAGGLLGYAYSASVTPAYEAEATLFVQSPSGPRGDFRLAGVALPTIAELVKSRPVLEGAIERLGLALTPEELAPDVRGESISDTSLLTIRARYPDSSVAVALANALAVELRSFVHSDEPRGVTPARGVRLQILTRDTSPTPVRPQTGLTMEFGALAALFAALGLAVFVELRRRRVRDEEDLARAGVPVLGSVDGGAVARRRLALPELWRPSLEVGSYDLLAARLSPSGNGRAPRSVLVLGTQAGDGSAAVAFNLVLTLAEAGTRVGVLDLSRRRDIMRLAVRKGLHSPIGKPMGSVRHEGVTLDRFRLEGSRPLGFLAAPTSTVPGRTSWDQAEALVARLLADADFLVVYASSLRRSPDALAWARAVDTTVVVARRQRTRQDRVASAVESLEQVRTKVVRTVLHTG